MIARIWHGWTTLKNAEKYEQLLKTEIFPGIENKKIEGFKNISLLKRTMDDEVEFVTIMNFKNWQAVKDFTGPDYKNAWVPENAKKLLKKYDFESLHYQILIN